MSSMAQIFRKISDPIIESVLYFGMRRRLYGTRGRSTLKWSASGVVVALIFSFYLTIKYEMYRGPELFLVTIYSITFWIGFSLAFCLAVGSPRLRKRKWPQAALVILILIGAGILNFIVPERTRQFYAIYLAEGLLIGIILQYWQYLSLEKRLEDRTLTRSEITKTKILE